MLQNQNSQFMFLKELHELEIDEKQFEKEIDIFSQFMSCCNPTYYYNGTYLKEFVHKFFVLKKSVSPKYAIGVEVLKEIWLVHEETFISLVVDDSFEFTSNEVVSNEINVKKLCDKYIEIKVKFSINNRDRLFYKKYDIVKFKNEDDSYNVKEIIADLTNWMRENQGEQEDESI